MADKNKNASNNAPADGEAKSNKGKKYPAPVYSNVDELTGLVQNHRSTTANDKSKHFTAAGFNAAGGIDSISVKAKGHMIASMILSLATSAQEDSEATEVLGMIGEYTASAKQQAKDAANLAALDAIARLEGHKLCGSDESIAQYRARILAAKK
jgi:hypothetical protein